MLLGNVSFRNGAQIEQLAFIAKTFACHARQALFCLLLQALRTALLQHQHSLADQQQVIELGTEPQAEPARRGTRRTPSKDRDQQQCRPAWAQHLQTALHNFQQEHPKACLPDMYICAESDP